MPGQAWTMLILFVLPCMVPPHPTTG
jgi:hypothetical protein